MRPHPHHLQRLGLSLSLRHHRAHAAGKAALQALHAAVVDECNRQASELGQTLHPPLTTYHKAYDRTHDVGARLLSTRLTEHQMPMAHAARRGGVRF